MQLITDIYLELIVYVKPDIMMTKLMPNVNHVVISVLNVLIPPILVPSVSNQELMNQNVHAQMECLIKMEPVLIVIINVQNVKQNGITVTLAVETEKQVIVLAQPIITMMVPMPIVHNVQIDVQLVTVVTSVQLVKLTEEIVQVTPLTDYVNVGHTIMKSVVLKEPLVMLTAHNQNVSHVTIPVMNVLEVQLVVPIVMPPENYQEQNVNVYLDHMMMVSTLTAQIVIVYIVKNVKLVLNIVPFVPMEDT